MCDEKERVDRIFELQLDRAEMVGLQMNMDKMTILKRHSYHTQRQVNLCPSKDGW